MNLLIDTHVALWWFDDPALLTEDARNAVADIKNHVYLSAASAWEIAIKRGLGKLTAPADLRSVLAANYFEALPSRSAMLCALNRCQYTIAIRLTECSLHKLSSEVGPW